MFYHFSTSWPTSFPNRCHPGSASGPGTAFRDVVPKVELQLWLNFVMFPVFDNFVSCYHLYCIYTHIIFPLAVRLVTPPFWAHSSILKTSTQVTYWESVRRSGRGEVILQTQHMYDYITALPSFEHLIGAFELQKGHDKFVC